MINAPFNHGDTKNNVFRNWSPENIIKKFDFFAENNIKNIKIADEMFVFKKQHYVELCKLIHERKYDFNIWAYARIDTVKEKYLETFPEEDREEWREYYLDPKNRSHILENSLSNNQIDFLSDHDIKNLGDQSVYDFVDDCFYSEDMSPIYNLVDRYKKKIS